MAGIRIKLNDPKNADVRFYSEADVRPIFPDAEPIKATPFAPYSFQGNDNWPDIVAFEPTVRNAELACSACALNGKPACERFVCPNYKPIPGLATLNRFARTYHLIGDLTVVDDYDGLPQEFMTGVTLQLYFDYLDSLARAATVDEAREIYEKYSRNKLATQTRRARAKAELDIKVNELSKVERDAKGPRVRTLFKSETVKKEPAPKSKAKKDKREEWESALLELCKQASDEELKAGLAREEAKYRSKRAKKIREKINELIDAGSENYVSETPLFELDEE